MARAIFIGGLTVGCLALGVVGAASAEGPAAECAAASALSGEFAPWAAPLPLAAGAEAGGSPRLQVGKAAELALLPAEGVRFPTAPGRQGGSGGLIELTIDRAGTYRVALGSPAWVDVISGGKSRKSTAHGHGEPCSGIRKIVDFALQPGRHIIAISGNPEPRTRILVVGKP